MKFIFLLTAEVSDCCHASLCRVDLNKMKAQSWGRVTQQQRSEHCPSFDFVDRINDPVTPCTSGRAPDQTGRFKTSERKTPTVRNVLMQSSQVYKPTPLFSALNATVAVQRVQSRQGQSEDAKKETSVQVSQVLNPELPLNQLGNITKASAFHRV